MKISKAKPKHSLKKGNNGYTLIELIIVVIVIGILAGIALISYPKYQESSRDTKRKSDLHAIADAYKAAENDGKAEEVIPGYTALGLNIPSRMIVNFPISNSFELLNPSVHTNLVLAGNKNNESQPGGELGNHGYLKNTLMDPDTAAPDITGGSPPASIQYNGYARIPCFGNGGTYYIAKLESPSSDDIEKFNSFKALVPSSNGNTVSSNPCFYAPEGDNLAEGNNPSYHNVIRAIARALTDESNGYNFVIHVK